MKSPKDMQRFLDVVRHVMEAHNVRKKRSNSDDGIDSSSDDDGAGVGAGVGAKTTVAGGVAVGGVSGGGGGAAGTGGDGASKVVVEPETEEMVQLNTLRRIESVLTMCVCACVRACVRTLRAVGRVHGCVELVARVRLLVVDDNFGSSRHDCSCGWFGVWFASLRSLARPLLRTLWCAPGVVGLRVQVREPVPRYQPQSADQDRVDGVRRSAWP